MSKTLIYYDEARFKSGLQAAAQGEAVLTDLLAYCQRLKLAAPIATADLPALLEQPADTIFDKYIGGATFNFGGLPLNRAKALELLEVPAEFQAFPAVAAEAKYALKNVGNGQHGLFQIASSYEINGNAVRFTATARKQLEESCKSYATTDTQAAVLRELDAISASLNRLRQMPSGHATSTVFEKGFVVPYHGDPGNVRPNPSFVQSVK